MGLIDPNFDWDVWTSERTLEEIRNDVPIIVREVLPSPEEGGRHLEDIIRDTLGILLQNDPFSTQPWPLWILEKLKKILEHEKTERDKEREKEEGKDKTDPDPDPDPKPDPTPDPDPGPESDPPYQWPWPWPSRPGDDDETLPQTHPVSYTHLTLPTIYSV